jgi:hypothetical protein
MANTFDPVDFVANAAGVGLAVLVDALTAPIVARRGDRTSAEGPPGT